MKQPMIARPEQSNQATPIKEKLEPTTVDFKGAQYLKYFLDKYGGKFDLSENLDAKAKDILIWLSWKENNFPAFKFFMTEFQDVLSDYKYGTSLWQNRIGQFYLKYGDVEKAIHYFKKGIEEFQNVEYVGLLYAGLSMAYYRKGNDKLVSKYYSKASLVASAFNNTELNAYLIRLKTLIETPQERRERLL